MKRIVPALLVFALAFFGVKAGAQGETTSAILGQVTDTSGAAVPGATVTIQNTETGLERTVATDDSGRFNFPQLVPGTYRVRVVAAGFDPQENDAVFSGLGQKQAVDFILKIAQANQHIEVSGQSLILNPENANTST
ncbi:MAG: carboxypeptidase-like regulatory domain-containing protein, partial [Candidatus Acidiferrales bacterium]